jgi:hypothetical protein
MGPLFGLLLLGFSAGVLSAQDFPDTSGLKFHKEERPVEIRVRAPSSMDRDNDAAKQMVLRVLDEYTGACGPGVVTRFQKLFGNGVTVGDGLQPVSADIIKEIANRIKARLKSDDIQVQIDSSQTGSAAWSATIVGAVVGGQIAIRPLDVERAIGADQPDRNVALLRRQEQLADSLLHETAHAFYSILQHEYKGVAAYAPEKITEAFPRSAFWDRSTPCSHADEGEFGSESCRGARNIFRLSSDGYSNARGNEETARQIANGIYSCTEGAAVHRILGLK